MDLSTSEVLVQKIYDKNVWNECRLKLSLTAEDICISNETRFVVYFKFYTWEWRLIAIDET